MPDILKSLPPYDLTKAKPCVPHGSRGLGAHVYKRGQIAAEKHTAKHGDNIPANGAWLDATSIEGQNY